MLGHQQDAILRVFLAITGPLTRARLRQTLRQEPRIALVGDATTGASLVAQLTAADPQFILCDEYILADPDVESFARHRSQSAARMFVLMVSNPELFTYHGDIPIVASLRLDLTGPEMVDRLAPLLEPPPLTAPAPVADMEDRFLVVGRGLGGTTLGPDPMPPHNPHRTRQLAPGYASTSPRLTVPLDRLSRRQHSDAHAELVDRLAMVQARLEQHRDGVTGLASPLALDSALRALQDCTCPTAVIVLQLWFVQTAGATKRVSLDDAALRRAAAALRATLRQEDLACRLEGTCFALVMAGLDQQTAPRPVERIRTALRVRSTHGSDMTVAAAVGVGYWQPPMDTTQPLEQAWQAMAADSRLQLS